MTAWSPGKIVDGKYRVDRVLGTGGMGTVLAARHLHLGQAVAIKVMRPSASEDEVSSARFVREARAAGSLRSEHVVEVKDFGTYEGCPYIVMEHLEGADLEHVLEARGKLGATEAAGYMLQACLGLAEAHAHGIIHRDLKPANMFVTRRPDGEPLLKLLDFGISKETWNRDGLTKTATAMGSPYYMSPEQIRSARGADARSDIWSLGAVLYELVAGRVPFEGESLFDVSVAVTRDDPRPVGIPELDAILKRCLAKPPQNRFETVADLADALARVGPSGSRVVAERVRRTLDGSKPSIQLPLPAAPPSPRPRKEAKAARPAALPRRRGTDASTMKFRRRRWPIVALMVGLVAAAVALVATWRPPKGPTVSPKPAMAMSPDSAPAAAAPDAQVTTIKAPPPLKPKAQPPKLPPPPPRKPKETPHKPYDHL